MKSPKNPEYLRTPVKRLTKNKGTTPQPRGVYTQMFTRNNSGKSCWEKISD